MHRLEVEDIEVVAHSLAIKMMEWNEPIPPFNTRYPGKLESCLKTPWTTFDKQDMYPTLEDKSAILFYLMIKDHPFQNGNKRIAITTLLTFLHMNNLWMAITNEALYDLAIDVAKSLPEEKEQTISLIRKTISATLVDMAKIMDNDIFEKPPN